jgi:hypothetical protein
VPGALPIEFNAYTFLYCPYCDFGAAGVFAIPLVIGFG